MGKCVIVAAGDLRIRSLKKEAGDFLIAVDGGYGFCKRLGVKPDLLVGDFDSVTAREKLEIEELEQKKPGMVARLNVEKDDTDTMAAARIGLEKGYGVFAVCGGMGGRLEHTIANIQTLLYLKKRGARGYLYDEECALFIVREEELVLPGERTGGLSLFCIGERAEGVTLEGLKYPLKDAVVTNDYPIGISNEFTGREARVTVKKGSLLALVRGEPARG